MRWPHIGSLRHRVKLEAPERVSDGGGGAITVWQPLQELWAGIEPTSGREGVVGGQLAGRVTHTIVVRHREGIEPAMRFRLGARIFEITGVLDWDERRRMLRCLCREELL